jgi:nucleotide-binding universal stress UspA family protein
MTVDDSEQISRLVVGFDASPESLDALHLADRLSVLTGADIHVVVVLADGWAGPGADPSDGDVEAHFDRLFEVVTAALDAGYTAHRVVGRSAPSGLTRIADEVDASAIVIGSSTHGPVGRVLMGDVGATLASGLHCSVIVAPRGYTRDGPDAIERIGIGFNGSPESRRALECGVRLARSLGAGARLIGVVPVVAGSGHFVHASPGYQRLIAEELEDRLAEAAVEAGNDTGYEVRTGDPADCLSEASSDFDLMVLSSRGYGPLRRVMMGGVSIRVMRSAACPVMIVPRGDDPA